jgi:hypothetical protein
MKIVEFFLIIRGKWSELEPEPEFLTSWSRSRSPTKMDRLRNTDRCRYSIHFSFKKVGLLTTGTAFNNFRIECFDNYGTGISLKNA